MPTNPTHERIAEFIQQHPQMTYAEIARALNIGYSTLTRIAALHGIRRPTGKRLSLNESALER